MITYVICKVGGDGHSDQSEFQNAVTMKRGVDDSTVYSIVGATRLSPPPFFMTDYDREFDAD